MLIAGDAELGEAGDGDRAEEHVQRDGYRVGERGDLALVLDARDEDAVRAGVDVGLGALERLAERRAAEPVGVDAGVDEDVAAGDGGQHRGVELGLDELVLEVDAGHGAEPRDVLGDPARVGAEAVLDVGGDVDGEVGQALDELDRRVRGRGRAVGQAERCGDAEAGRADGREPGGGERGGGGVVPGVREHERRALAVQGGERRHRAPSTTPAASARACVSPGQARGPAPRDAPARSTITSRPAESSRRVTGTGGSPPRSPTAPARGCSRSCSVGRALPCGGAGGSGRRRAVDGHASTSRDGQGCVTKVHRG